MRRSVLLAWSPWAVTMLLTSAAVALVVLTRDAPAPVALLFRGSEAILSVVTASVGVVIASRKAHNPIGWLFSAAGLAIGVLVFSEHYAVYALLVRPGAPAGTVAAWLQGWIGPIGYFTTLALLLLLFPTGHLPSRRWRPVTWLTIASAAVFLTGWSVRPGPLDVLTFVDNPLGIGGRAGELATTLARAGELMLFASLLLSAPALFVRFRRSRGIERQQLKWLVSAASFLAFMIVVFIVLGTERLPLGLEYLVLPAFAAIPVAGGIAIVRHQLFDIDRIISRTATYAIVTSLLVAGYVGFVVLFQRVFSPLTGTSDLTVAVSTLIAAAAFVPLRRRVQQVIDRRFNRARYDAARTIEAFSARLREQIDIDALGAEVQSIIQQTMQPAHISLWLRNQSR